MGSGFYVLPSIAGGSAHATLVAAIGRARKDKRVFQYPFPINAGPQLLHLGAALPATG
jgi:hypothetical protein